MLKAKELIKKINIKNLLVIICLILFQCVCFFFSKPLLRNIQVLNSVIDDHIPFISEFIWIYVSWYLMLVIFPYYIAKKDKTAFLKYCSTYIVAMIISTVIFIILPKSVTRATITGTNLSSKLVQLIYTLDNPGVNCFPSIHCLLSFLFLFGAISCKKNMPLTQKLFIVLSSLAVVFSTFFVKQHVVYDALLSLAVCAVSWAITDIFKLHNRFENVYDRIKVGNLK